MCRICVESISGSYSGQDRAAGDAEDGVDAGGLQRADEALRSGDLLGHLRDLSRDGVAAGNKKPLGPSVDSRGVARSAEGQPARSAKYEDVVHVPTLTSARAGVNAASAASSPSEMR